MNGGIHGDKGWFWPLVENSPKMLWLPMTTITLYSDDKGYNRLACIRKWLNVAALGLGQGRVCCL